MNTKKANEQSFAIIGMSTRLPGSKNLHEFWETLFDKEYKFEKPPLKRWQLADLKKPEKEHLGGFIEDIDSFDAKFFNMSEQEAAYMGPQQRLLLETAWEATEHAGIDLRTLSGSNTGVFVGNCNHDYTAALFPKSEHMYTSMGTAGSLGANRISHIFKLNGPSISIDTACSSSLTAIHLACQSLQNGECNLALVGASSIFLVPSVTDSLANAGMISAKGRCTPFSADADGYIRSEGAAMLALKPVNQAIEDNNNIIAIIKGSSINHNGEANGLTAPNPHSQKSLLARAYKNANVSPENVGYFEAAATGSSMGDLIEYKSISDFFSTNRSSSNSPMKIGSLKTKLGHLEGVGGIAAVIKTALILKNQKIPASIDKSNLNPLINQKNDSIIFASETSYWPVEKNKKRYAAISSFGFGGSNAHLILEEPKVSTTSTKQISNSKWLLPISAKSHFSLVKLLKEYSSKLDKVKEIDANQISYNASVRRSHFKHRECFSFTSIEQLRELISRKIKALSDKKNNSLSQDLFIQLNGSSITDHTNILNFFNDDDLFSNIIDEIDDYYKEHFSESFKVCLQQNESDKHKESAILTNFLMELSVAKWMKSTYGAIKGFLTKGYGELSALVLLEKMSLEEAVKLIKGEGLATAKLKQEKHKLPVFYYDSELKNLEGKIIEPTWRKNFKKTFNKKIKTFNNSLIITTNHESKDAEESIGFSVNSLFDFEEVSHFIKWSYLSGLNIEWKQLLKHNFSAHMELPTYQFQRDVLWPEELSKKPKLAEQDNGPIIGSPINLPMSKEMRWEYSLSPQSSTLLEQHKVLNKHMMSPATLIVMCLSNLIKDKQWHSLSITNLSLNKPLQLSLSEPAKVQIIISPRTKKYGEFQLVSHTNLEGSFEWEQLLAAEYLFDDELALDNSSDDYLSNLNPIDNTDIFSKFTKQGYEFGSCYRWLYPVEHTEEQRLLDNHNLVLAPSVTANNDFEPFHPTLLHSCLMVTNPVMNTNQKDEVMFFPTRINRMNIRNISCTDKSKFILNSNEGENKNSTPYIFSNLNMHMENGELLLAISGVHYNEFSIDALEELLLTDKQDIKTNDEKKETVNTHLKSDLNANSAEISNYLSINFGKILGRDFLDSELSESMMFQGFDSLKASELKFLLNKEMNFDLPLIDILTGLTGADLVLRIVEHLDTLEANKNEFLEPEVKEKSMKKVEFPTFHQDEEIVEVEL